MNFSKALTLFLSFLISLSAIAASPVKPAVWGEIVYNPKVKTVPYSYFVYYKEKGVAHAYPIDTNDPKIAKEIIKHVGKRVRIEGEIKKVTLQLDGPPQSILAFSPTSIKPLALSDLAVKEPVAASPNTIRSHQNNPASASGGIEVPDAVANSLIFAAAAALLGGLIK